MAHTPTALLMTIACAVSAMAQSNNRSSHIVSNQIEQLIEDAVVEGQEGTLVEALTQLLENPVNINTASFEALCQVPGLDPVLAGKIIEVRVRRKFQTVEELTRIDGIDENLISRLRPFVFAVQSASEVPLRFPVAKLRSRVVHNLSDHQAVQRGAYGGSAERIATRINAAIIRGPDPEISHVSPHQRNLALDAGLLVEKDPGEPNWADFISGYAALKLLNSGLSLILGDYAVDASHGEVFSSDGTFTGGFVARGGEGRLREGLRPLLASELSNQWRGGALAWNSGRVNCYLLSSFKGCDAVIDSTGSVVAFRQGGTHRTKQEIAEKNQVQETTFGARLSAEAMHGLRLGASVRHAQFDREVRLSKDGRALAAKNLFGGMDMLFTSGSFLVSLEMARWTGGIQSLALVSRWNAGRSFGATASLRFREEGDRTRPAAANPSWQSARMSEIGIAARVRVAPTLKISALFEQYFVTRHPSSNLLPGGGHDLLLSADLSLKNGVDLDLRYRHKRKPDLDVRSGDGIVVHQDGSLLQSQLRASLIVNMAKGVRSRTRIETTEVKRQLGSSIDRGILMYQECLFDVLERSLICLRCVAFETTSYDARMYEFEEELPGAYQSPVLYGKGLRWFFRGELGIFSWLRVSMKYARTQFHPPRSTDPLMRMLSIRQEERWSIQCDMVW